MKFNEIQKLYHFTSFESAIKIVQDRTLRYSPMKRMNDIFESNRQIFVDNNMDNPYSKIELIKSEFARYRQISLTQDTEGTMGFAISPMWGHYAEKGNGVCLVFDKNKIIEKLQCGEYCNPISYEEGYTGAVICDQSEINMWFQENHNDIFFRKSNEWSYEQEYRIVKRSYVGDDKCEYLYFEDALVAVIMCYARGASHNQSVSCSENYNILTRLAGVPILEYGSFFNDISLKDGQGNSIWSSNDIDTSMIDV